MRYVLSSFCHVGGLLRELDCNKTLYKLPIYLFYEFGKFMGGLNGLNLNPMMVKLTDPV